MNRMSLSPGIELGAALGALPLSLRNEGILKSIEYAYNLGFASPLWTKVHAIRLAFQANMDRAMARGKGNRAKRRQEAQDSLHRWYEDRRLTISDVDALAELLGEGRAHPQQPNFHDN